MTLLKSALFPKTCIMVGDMLMAKRHRVNLEVIAIRWDLEAIIEALQVSGCSPTVYL